MRTAGRPLRILHIDDEPVNLLVLEHLLREHLRDAAGFVPLALAKGFHDSFTRALAHPRRLVLGVSVVLGLGAVIAWRLWKSHAPVRE
jgi:hypothetical protein